MALWSVPLAVVRLLAWFRPDAAGWVFTPLVAVMVGLSIWSAVDPNGWRSVENHNGPVQAVIVFALATALALWGLRRTLQASVMLLVVGVVPVVISTTGHNGLASLAAASSAPVITGLLYLASAYVDRRRPPPRVPRQAIADDAQHGVVTLFHLRELHEHSTTSLRL